MFDEDRFQRRLPGTFPPRFSTRRFVRSAGLCIALFAFVAHPARVSAWQFVESTDDGIQIFQKESGDSSLVALRGIGVVDAPLPLVATIIFDTDRRRDWIEGLAESRIVRWKDRDHFIEYDHIKMPIFFTDRDFVSNVTLCGDASGDRMVFHYQPSDDTSVPRTGYIRGDLINLTFILTSEQKKTRIDASFLSDPKGWIPKWLVNFFLEDWPKTTFRNLRKEVLKDIPVDPRFAALLKCGEISR